MKANTHETPVQKGVGGAGGNERDAIDGMPAIYAIYGARGATRCSSVQLGAAWCSRSHNLKGSYKRVKGRSHPVEKRPNMHPHKPHATT